MTEIMKRLQLAAEDRQIANLRLDDGSSLFGVVEELTMDRVKIRHARGVDFVPVIDVKAVVLSVG